MAVRRIWHPQDIIAEVRKRGSSLAALSRANGLASRTLQTCVAKKRWPRGNQIIADYLGVTRHQIWPHWYGRGDELLPLTRPQSAKASVRSSTPRSAG